MTWLDDFGGDEDQIRDFMERLGRASREAQYRFLARLPAIEAARMHRRWGYQSLAEYAARVATLPTARRKLRGVAQRGSAGDRARGAESSGRPDPGVEAEAPGACAGAGSSEDPGAPPSEGASDPQADVAPSSSFLRLSVSPLQEVGIRRLKQLLEIRRGEAMSLGALFSELAEEKLVALLSTVEVPDRRPICSREKLEKEPLERLLGVARPGPEEAAAPPSEASSGDVSAPRSGEASSARRRSLPRVRRRANSRRLPYVLVVYRPADGGPAWSRSLRGPVALPDEAYLDRPLDAAPVDLGKLREDALKAAARAGPGGPTPAEVVRFVAIRSGGHCEVEGCHDFAVALHHVRARAEGGDHHPDGLQACCAAHHEEAHGDPDGSLANTCFLERRRELQARSAAVSASEDPAAEEERREASGGPPKSR